MRLNPCWLNALPPIAREHLFSGSLDRAVYSLRNVNDDKRRKRKQQKNDPRIVRFRNLSGTFPSTKLGAVLLVALS